MTITDKIRKSIEAATGLRAHYQSIEELNRIADTMQYPACFYFLLDEQGITTEGGNIRERISIAVFFVDLATGEIDFNSERNEEVIDEQKRRAFRWIRALPKDRYLKLISVNGSQRVYDYFDVQLTGYAVRVTVEELQGVNCDDAQ